MKFENGRYYAGDYTAYRFTKGEIDLIAQAIKSFIPKLEKKITRIENHPRNEGQATYSVKISELQGDIATNTDDETLFSQSFTIRAAWYDQAANRRLKLEDE